MNQIQLSYNSLFATEKDYSQHEDSFNKGIENWPPSFARHFFQDIDFESLERLIEQLDKNAVQAMVVIGMGGSSLGAKALLSFFGQPKRPLFFLEGTHPQVFAQLKQKLADKKIAILFISKSGTTLESRSQLELTRQHFTSTEEYYVTSNPEKIADLCTDKQRIFLIPTELGGRFSIVSPVGIIPGLFMGADMRDFMQGFKAGLSAWGSGVPAAENGAKRFAIDLVDLFQADYQGMVLWVYSRELFLWGDWLLQLWGESVGKAASITALPFLCRGPEDQHSLLQFFLDGPNNYAHVFVFSSDYGEADFRLGEQVKGDFNNKSLSEILNAQEESIVLALNEMKRPVCEFDLGSLYEDGQPNMFMLGKFMCFFMFVTAYSGYLYQVNPFDQPAVEKGKVYCKRLLAKEKIDSVFSGHFEL